MRLLPRSNQSIVVEVNCTGEKVSEPLLFEPDCRLMESWLKMLWWVSKTQIISLSGTGDTVVVGDEH